MKIAKTSAIALTVTFLAFGIINSAQAKPNSKSTTQSSKNSDKSTHALPTFSPNYSQKEIEAATDTFMESFSSQRLYATIFRYNPNVKAEVRKEAKNIVSTSHNTETAFYRGQALGAMLTRYYFNKAVIKAPNAKVYELLKYDLEVMESLKSNPQLCFNHSIGAAISPTDAEKLDFDKFSDLKSDIIESAYTNLTEFIPIDKDEILNTLKSEFVKNKFDEQNIEKLKNLKNLSPEDGCEVMYEFGYSLKTLGEDNGATLFKSIVYLQVEK